MTGRQMLYCHFDDDDDDDDDDVMAEFTDFVY